MRKLAGGIVGRVGDRLRRLRNARGTAELSVVVVAASLVAGVVFGDGLSRTALRLADGVTWISDEPTGEVIQVNPATGRPELRLGVGNPGDDLSITQYDGRMIVTNRTTGEMTSFDLSSILVSGQRRVAAGDASDLLVHEESVFVVDRDRGSIAAIDPTTTDEIGQIWVSDDGIVDATIDTDGQVWSVDDHGLVTSLRWSESSAAFLTEGTRQVDNSGPGSVLVGHDEGATLFGPDRGIVVQVGTDADVVAAAPRLSGQLASPQHAPAELAPVAVPDTGTVVMVSGDTVLEVDVAATGCSSPDRPEVLGGIVYVPCPGDGKLVRLNADGLRAGDDITTPEGKDPELVPDDGALVVNVPGSPEGLVIDDDGSVKTIVRYDEALPSTPVHNVGNQPAPPPPQAISNVVHQDLGVPPPGPVSTSQPPPQQSNQTKKNRNQKKDRNRNKGRNNNQGQSNPNGPGPDDGGGTDDGTEPPPEVEEPLTAPTGVVAELLGDGSVRVTWGHDGTPADEFTVARVGAGDLAEAPGDDREARVDVPEGPSHRFTVTAHRAGDDDQTSAPSAAISTEPEVDPVSAPTAVTAEVLATGQVRVRWNHMGTAADEFTVNLDGGGPLTEVSGSARQATVTVPEGPSHRFTVTAHRAGDPDQTSSRSAAVSTMPEEEPDPDPVAAPTGVSATVLGSGDVRVSWNHSGTEADDFVVRRVGGGASSTVGGSSRQVDLSVDQGTHRFTVTARRAGDPDRISAESGSVTTSGRPGAVSGIGGSVRGSASNNNAEVQISWSAAADNGSPITRYRLSINDHNGNRTLTTNGATSTSYTTSCGGPYCDPGPVQVTITAENANGDGPSANGTLTYDGPHPPSLPGAGANVATNANTGGVIPWEGGGGNTTIQLNAPSGWRNFSGTCRYVHHGNQHGASGSTYNCNAGSVTVSISHGMRRGHVDGHACIGGPDDLGHSIQFFASNGVDEVASARFNWTERQQVYSTDCQIP